MLGSQPGAIYSEFLSHVFEWTMVTERMDLYNTPVPSVSTRLLGYGASTVRKVRLIESLNCTEINQNDPTLGYRTQCDQFNFLCDFENESVTF